MPAFDPVSMGIGAAVGLAQTVTGIVNNKKAKKAAEELERTRPQYRMSTQTGRELDLAESELASGGMSARAEAAYNNLTNQQFAGSLSAILKGGGTVNNVAETFGESEEGRQRLRLLNDEMRLKQIQNLTMARRNYGEQEDKQFMYNVDQPWKDKAAAVAASRQQAQQDIWGGIKTVGGTAMQAAASAYNWNRYEKSLQLTNPTFQTGTQPSARTIYHQPPPAGGYGDFEDPFESDYQPPTTTRPRLPVTTYDYDAWAADKEAYDIETGLAYPL